MSDDPLTVCCKHLANSQAILDAKDAEIERLRDAIRRLADQDATLTDAEREAIWTVAEAYAANDGDQECERIARAMHGLWQRTK